MQKSAKKLSKNVKFIGAYNGRFLFLINSVSKIPSWTGYYLKIPVYISDPDDDNIDINTGGICGDLELRREGFHCIKPFFGIVRYNIKELCSSKNKILKECIPLVKNSYIHTPEAYSLVSYLLKDKGVDSRKHFDELKEYYLQTDNIEKDKDMQKKFIPLLKKYWKDKYIDDIRVYFDFIKKCGNIEIFKSITLVADEILEEYNYIKNFSNYRMNIIDHLGRVKSESYVKIDGIKHYDDNPKNFIKEIGKINNYIDLNNFYGLNLGYFKSLPYEKDIYSAMYINPKFVFC